MLHGNQVNSHRRIHRHWHLEDEFSERTRSLYQSYSRRPRFITLQSLDAHSQIKPKTYLNGPKEITVDILCRLHLLTIRKNDLNLDKVIDSKAVLVSFE
jgi:hypothetical protein